MKKTGVVWVSTVLYILISLAVLSIVLVAVQPRINAARDKATIDQTINMLNELDQKIIEVDNSAQGNVRSLNMLMRKGTLTVYTDYIAWEFEGSSYKYSEPNRHVKIGRIDSYTTEVPGGFNVILTLNYKGMNLIPDFRSLPPAETPYKIFVKNNGSMNGANQILINTA